MKFPENSLHPIGFARRFLNEYEQRYSTNEIELISVVGVVEHFKNYMIGKKKFIQTDHPALLTALKDNKGVKNLPK